MSKKSLQLFALLGLLVPLALSQPTFTPPSEYPVGNDYFPDDTINLQGCVNAQVYVNGVYKWFPVPGAFVTFQPQADVVLQSGYHQHEGIIGDGPRPKGTFLGSNTGTTGDDGCTPSLSYQLPGIAGIYTWKASYTNAGVQRTVGLSSYVYQKYWDNTEFIPYPDNSAINRPAGMHIDNAHFAQSRWFVIPAAAKVTAASVAYKAMTSANGVIDLVDVRRGSLPWGGIADNRQIDTMFSTLGLWRTEAEEWHEFGVELDVSNPSSVSPYRADYYDLLLRAFGDQGCYVGKFGPDSGSPLSNAYEYWRTKPDIHMVCGTAFGYSDVPRPTGYGLPGSGRGTGHQR